MKYSHGLAFLPALALLSACGGGSTTADNAAGSENVTLPGGDNLGAPADDNMEMGNDTAMAPTSMTAQQFADTAAASDAFEIESGKLAEDKATAQGLKDFGAMMVKDHTSSTAKLKAAASKNSITPAPALNAEQTANLEALRNASGADFDSLYKSQQLAAHEKALAAMQGYAATGDNADLKVFAGTTAPVVENHLNMLRGM